MKDLKKLTFVEEDTKSLQVCSRIGGLQAFWMEVLS